MGEKIPGFLGKFIKQGHPHEAGELKASIVELRQRAKEKEKAHEEKQKERYQHEAEAQALLGQIETATQELAQMTDSWSKKFLHFFESRAKKQKLSELDTQRQDYEARSLELGSELSNMEQDLDEEGRSFERREAQYLIDRFLSRQKEIWREAEHTKEDVAELFSEEHLARLSLDDYVLLMQRFPGNMLTHVTRQGVRDHVAMDNHRKGLGEFHNGFTQILEQKKLNSILSQAMVGEGQAEKILQILGNPRTQAEGLKTLHNMVRRGVAPAYVDTYSDPAAVHFAAENVADVYYGAERNNEIFFAIPSLAVTSQYRFYGSFVGGSSEWNDVWVWTKEQEGVDINAQIVFIPADARVDPQTGSRYELEDNHVIKNEGLIAQYQNFTSHPDHMAIVSEIYDLRREREHLDNIVRRLEIELGITDDALRHAILTSEYLGMGGEVFLSMNGLLYEHADETVSSQEYWEDYFFRHEDQRPNKIVYYSGRDPTRALDDWKRDHHIRSVDVYRLKTGEDDEQSQFHMGYPEHSYSARNYEDLSGTDIGTRDDFVFAGKDRFISLATQIIKEHLPDEEK